MQTAVVGAGPTGLYTAIALARRGHRVTVIDRDAGPGVDGTWNRKGVMQFLQPHGFRQQVEEALLAEMPEIWDDLRVAGAEPAVQPGQPRRVVGFRCRRLTFERVLRSAAVAERGVSLRTGHVDDLISEQGRAVGVRVNGQNVAADLVIDASGRAGRLTRAFRSPVEGGDCGVSYVSRQYQLLPDADEGPTNSPVGLSVHYPGYLAIVFVHDNRTFSVHISRASSERALDALRFQDVFDAAIQAIPGLSAWSDPARSRPISPVLPGGRLYNTFRSQALDGRPAAHGLVSVGDAVCTTTPLAGRGVALSLMQAQRLVGLLDEHGRDFTSCLLAFDHWCEDAIRPWFDDHVHSDADLVRRWSGQDVDLTRRLPSDVIAAAAAANPAMFDVVGPFATMQALPSSLAAVEPLARQILTSGWRPPIPDGPSKDELVQLVIAVSPHRRVLVGQ